ncbi:hypothetical protein [Streptomyces odonnellii]|uniref:hypothetical protein n=1 Tax=Streptomyces odonnellii TaxID=1417980 RepID=UPI000AE94A23|nr:hypothetical protein [Streptomyces odonnellii]
MAVLDFSSGDRIADVTGAARGGRGLGGCGCAWAAATFVPTSVAMKLAAAVKLAARAEHAAKTGEDAAQVLADLKKIYGE